MSDNTKLTPIPDSENDYSQTLQAIKERIRIAQYQALKKVNTELISAYQDIGRIIVEKQEQQGWGENVVKRLAKDLQVEFPGVRGFSLRNLWYMRTLYLTYKDKPNVQPLVAQISWSHNLAILDRCKTDLEREFYLQAAAYYGWSKLTLIDNIKHQAYERWALKQTSFDHTLSEDQQANAVLAVKDDYNFDFLDIAEPHNERKVESALVAHVVKFLAEMGKYYTFVGRQYRIEFHGDEYFIDLLFYHRKLKCLVALDLKARAFKPEDAGKMQFYQAALDANERVEGENPTIGMIICQEKDRLMVEYTLKDVNRPIGVATYNSYSRLKDLPAEIAKYLPSEEELQKRFGDIRLLASGGKDTHSRKGQT